MSIFPKWSEWRKRDFHVHTPESILNSWFGNDRDVYVQNLFRKAIANDISWIGVTDYFTIDWYKKLRLEYLNNDTKLNSLFDDDEIQKIKKILVFPNIEFRIDRLVTTEKFNDKWNRNVNFHILFSNLVTIEDIEERFLNILRFETLTSDTWNKQTLTLTKRNLEEFWKKIKDQHEAFSWYSDIFVWMMNASINIDLAKDALETCLNTFQWKYLFALPADEDLSKVSRDGSWHSSRKVLIQKSHLIMSWNPNTAKFWLWKMHPDQATFKAEFNTLKPCVRWSDAHEFEKMFEPDENRNTWVKANLTFEGLKAVIFDPIWRVCIQANKPVSKADYLVIDKVRFIDNSGSNQLQNSVIELNENLNTIIWWKSSWKSLLLYHIAKSIDPEQVKLKSNRSISDYSALQSENPFDFEVIWKDNRTDKLSEKEGKIWQITYIPQLYINHLAERDWSKDLDNLIENILLQNQKFKTKHWKILELRSKSEENIASLIQKLLTLSYDALSKQKEIKAIGTKEQLEWESKRLKDLIEKLTKSSWLTAQQIVKFDNLTEKKVKSLSDKAIFEKRFTAYDSLIQEIELVLDKNEKLLTETIQKRIVPTDDTIKKNLEKISKDYTDQLNTLHENMNVELKMKLKTTKESIEKNDKDLKETIKKLEPFNKTLNNKKILQGEQKKLEWITKKIEDLKAKKIEFNKTIEQGKAVKQEIFENYSKLLSSYQAIVAIVNDPLYKKIADDLSLNAVVEFDIEGFSRSFSWLFDKRSSFNKLFNQRFDDDNNFIFIEEQHVGNINMIFDKIRTTNDDLRLRSGVNEDEKYQRLFNDYFKVKYSVKYKWDDILIMSPGKRGLVLLQLILHISTATHPILIDQPEDNLDNRTIYDELKEFVKEKKNMRQIIIVTHNANLVVSTDAECIIVANQDWQQLWKDNKKFKFEYITGSLENTFVNDTADWILYAQWIKEHVCDILEGGTEAFLKREQKYGLSHLK